MTLNQPPLRSQAGMIRASPLPAVQSQPRPAARRMGLSGYLVGFGLALLLPVLALGALSAWQVAVAYQDSFAGRLRDTARALALALDSEFEALQAAALAVASAPAVQDQRDDPTIEAWLAGLGKALGNVAIAIVPGPPTALGAARQDASAGEAAADPVALLVGKVLLSGHPAVSPLYRQADGALAVSVAVPVRHADRPDRAVLVTFDPGRLAQALVAQRATGGVAGLADGSGINVARSRGNERFVGAPAPWFELAAGQQEAVFRGRNFEGVPILFGFRRLGVAEGWGVVIGEPLAVYEASWRPPLIRLGIGAVLAIALAIAAAAVLARRVLAPVGALRRQAEEVAAGGSGLYSRAAVAAPAPVAEFELLRLALLRADAALRAGAAEFRTAFEQAAIAMSQSDPESGRLLRVNVAYCNLIGRPASQVVGLPFVDFIHPDDRDAAMRGWWAMAHGETAVFETERRYLRPDGSIRWVSGSVTPVRDPHSGKVVRTLAAFQDITDRKAAEERQWLLTRELDHRAKNLLAVVQAALRLTPRTDAAEYARAVEGRIAALARAHTLLAQARWSGAELREVVGAELAAFLDDAPKAARVELDGPPVTLPPAAVQALSMALHELATNATKHGALSVRDGQLLVHWRLVEPAGRLLLRWVERNGPPVAGRPARRGFGSRVLLATMRDQLGGRVEQVWDPAGLECEMEFPLGRAVQAAKGQG
ncbi:MAG: domain S-box protein [Belnapia sp.]|nr:domain S-box protein [Belnapia sp.]